jgi:tetratricopeptide (TPR) repeat protein
MTTVGVGLNVGELVGGRFRIEEQVGSGAMGTVYRAFDEASQTRVALKVLHGGVPEGQARFAREVGALARMSHPVVVRYVAHGERPTFVAMQWLEGEDLGQRLRRGPLPVDEAIRVAVRVADAIEHMHSLGVVHRDIKPGNLFFEHKDAAQVRVVDFGLAWIEGDVSFRSAAGTLVGTPGYMAPEQIRGEDVDTRTDVFALGCVLYKCLTGRGPFASGGDAVATLAKILFHEPERASARRPEIPHALDGVLARALAKDRTERYATARAFADALRAITFVSEPLVVPHARVSSDVLTHRERRIVSVVVAAREGLGGDASTVRRLGATFTDRESVVRELAARHGARLEVLPVAIIGVLTSAVATDEAARAARFALALHEALGNVPVALATGHAELGAGAVGHVVGEVIDRAVARVTTQGAGAVALDETTAGLLGPTFLVHAGSMGMTLVSERAAEMRLRTLLGKPTPCVGRDRELSFLDATLNECRDEEVARCVLVLAPAGVGKSRVRYEWAQRLGDVEVWSARADPMTSGSPFTLVADLVRRTTGIEASEPAAASRARLRARLSRCLHDEATLQRVAEFLGEVVGLRFPDEGRVQLRAARQDPQLMADQVRRAWEDWVGAEASDRPLVILLEDLHWGDPPTVQLVDYALTKHAELPLMVVALARPEVKDVFPGLWAKQRPIELVLGELPRKAAARLARHVLGDATLSDEAIERIVARAAGNAFFLEEILRAVAEGRGDDIPDTVLAMVQHRLDALEPEARRVLRAASVFGETFWRDAVQGQIGRVDDWLMTLERLELVTPLSESRFAGEQELTFRHALVRDAAYATLTDDDRSLAHRSAGAWLEQHGERDAGVLAGHYDRGSDTPRAIDAYTRAAAQALQGNDLSHALKHVERAGVLGATGPILGQLRRTQAEALRWQGRMAEAEASAREASELLEPGTTSWHGALAELATVAGALAHVDVLLAARSALIARGDPSQPEYAIALARVVSQLYVAGERSLADETIARMDTLDTHGNPVALARIEQSRAYRALYSSDQSTYYERLKAARSLFELAGDRRTSCLVAGNMGYVALALGALDEADEALASMARVADAIGAVRLRGSAQQNTAWLRHLQGRDAEAIPLARRSAEMFEQQGDKRMAAFSRIYLTMALDATGEVDAAFDEATRAVALSEPLPPAHASALANLADLELRHHRVEDALAHAREAHRLMETLGGLEESEPLVRVVYAEALAAAGRTGEARDVVRGAMTAMQEHAAKIATERWRASFATVPENMRTVALAAKLGV